MEFVAASNNPHKLAEMRRILEAMGHSVKSLAELGLTVDPEETGTTFEENALIKAKEVCAATGLATIADDSGLEVDALDGAPGVCSARFAGGHGNDDANNQKLLQLLKNVPAPKRTARFVSVIALAMPSGASLLARGQCAGNIGFAPAGTGGFGYDPLFFVNNKSFAQLSAAEKDTISHRAKALEEFGRQLPQFLNQE
ncbi:RdgB/HAM1 family non-canonical purine NTP pyrophosphatase [Ruminococcaceae bacterium OttesenSCG-928-A16]|nr:RdgB/HAM1 family non-canonical purine NTP pyrophosphatase [Ruminococcaceae bacterium OttesenSCG-928-A16]